MFLKNNDSQRRCKEKRKMAFVHQIAVISLKYAFKEILQLKVISPEAYSLLI